MNGLYLHPIFNSISLTFSNQFIILRTCYRSALTFLPSSSLIPIIKSFIIFLTPQFVYHICLILPSIQLTFFTASLTLLIYFPSAQIITPRFYFVLSCLEYNPLTILIFNFSLFMRVINKLNLFKHIFHFLHHSAILSMSVRRPFFESCLFSVMTLLSYAYTSQLF